MHRVRPTERPLGWHLAAAHPSAQRARFHWDTGQLTTNAERAIYRLCRVSVGERKARCRRYLTDASRGMRGTKGRPKQSSSGRSGTPPAVHRVSTYAAASVALVPWRSLLLCGDDRTASPLYPRNAPGPLRHRVRQPGVANGARRDDQAGLGAAVYHLDDGGGGGGGRNESCCDPSGSWNGGRQEERPLMVVSLLCVEDWIGGAVSTLLPR